MKQSLTDIPTIQLVEELLARAKHVDAVLSLVTSGAMYYDRPAKVTAAPLVRRAPRRLSGIKRSDFVAAVPKDGAPRTVHQYSKLAGCSYTAAYCHLVGLVKDGRATTNINVKPRLYTLKDGGGK